MNVIQKLVQWAEARQITQQVHDTASFTKNIVEELGELIAADKVNDMHERIDAIADVVVFGITELARLGYNPEQVLEETHREINSRQGAWNEEKRKWVKDANQDPSTLYKADYWVAKL